MLVDTVNKALRTLRRTISIFITGPTPLTVTGPQARRFFAQYESDNQRLVESVAPQLSAARTIFDVGANAGYFSKKIIESGFKGRIVLFEPVPHLLATAVETLSGFENEKVFVDAALGESNGSLTLYLPQNTNIGWITAVREKAQKEKTVAARLAETMPYIQLFNPEFIKIDVEGYELHILRPFLKCVSDTYRPTFLIELGWGVTNPYWGEFIEVAGEFINRGYKFCSTDARQHELGLADLKTLSRTIDVILKPA